MFIKKIRLKVLNKNLGESYTFPNYQTDGSAAVDLRASLSEAVELKAGERLLVDTGVAIFIEDKTICGLIFARSGLAHNHGIVLSNGVGVIDSDYQGALKVSLHNISNKTYMVSPGERIAQLSFFPFIKASFEWVEDFKSTPRGERGFGHTGKF